jgi:hypothetical protein
MADVMEALLREYPNGVSFDPMAVRLLRKKFPLEDGRIRELRSAMLQLGGGLWFLPEMILDDRCRAAFKGQTIKWLTNHGCFSVERLFENYCHILRHIDTPEGCAAFLQHMGYTVSAWRNNGFFCFQPPSSLDERLAAISRTITELLGKKHGTLPVHEVETAMPHLTVKALAGIRAQYMREIHEVNIGGIPCWCNADTIPLPDDFAEKLTTAVDTLVALTEKVSVAKLEFALNLFYGFRFREEYALPDNNTFMRLCAKHYQGDNNVFPKARIFRARGKKHTVSYKIQRRRNTCFYDLGVPVGAKLVFNRNSQTICTVMDGKNKVEYDGKKWAISILAQHLLGWSTAHGYYHFSYEGETLWDRRVRLEREGKHDKHPAKERHQPIEMREKEIEIIGLEGKALSQTTWQAYRNAGKNPCVADWAQRFQNGEPVEQIARELGCSVAALKVRISNYRLYFKVCKLNGIEPECDADV